MTNGCLKNIKIAFYRIKIGDYRICCGKCQKNDNKKERHILNLLPTALIGVYFKHGKYKGLVVPKEDPSKYLRLNDSPQPLYTPQLNDV